MFLNTKIYNQINSLLKSRIFNQNDFRDIDKITSYLYSVKSFEAREWIKNNKVSYLQGLLEGFEIDNSQESQLKDLKTR